ncbi:MAG: hypothetical protein ACR2NX_05795 [Chthoniobacterales bacterium]
MKTESRSPMIASGVATPNRLASSSMTAVMTSPASSPANAPAAVTFPDESVIASSPAGLVSIQAEKQAQQYYSGQAAPAL